MTEIDPNIVNNVSACSSRSNSPSRRRGRSPPKKQPLINVSPLADSNSNFMKIEMAPVKETNESDLEEDSVNESNQMLNMQNDEHISLLKESVVSTQNKDLTF